MDNQRVYVEHDSGTRRVCPVGYPSWLCHSDLAGIASDVGRWSTEKGTLMGTFYFSSPELRLPFV